MNTKLNPTAREALQQTRDQLSYQVGVTENRIRSLQEDVREHEDRERDLLDRIRAIDEALS